MIFSLDVRRARKGDCLLLHFGTARDPGLVVIDGGPADVYTPQLKPRLDAIRQARHLKAGTPLVVDALMVSHIDDDHINGVLELTKELIDLQRQRKPLPVKIRALWHNSFDDIIGNSPEELLKAVTSSYGLASLSDEPDAEGLAPDTAMVLASISQGVRLRDDAKALKLRVNPQFSGALAMSAKGEEPVDMTRGLTFTVAGPMQDDLRKLQTAHDKFLEKQRERARAGTAALASFTDTSVANLSSIVVLAQAGGKQILLTGDARGDKVLEGLRLIGALPAAKPLHVDVLKMPHHGSDRNMTLGFLKRVTADHYVFSGNGEHGNPERDTLEMLRRARGSADYAVHITYPIDEIDIARQAEWVKQQAKERARKAKNPKTKVRKNWSPAEHSLAAFMRDHPDFAERVTIVPAQGAHVIDLHDRLGY